MTVHYKLSIAPSQNASLSADGVAASTSVNDASFSAATGSFVNGSPFTITSTDIGGTFGTKSVAAAPSLFDRVDSVNERGTVGTPYSGLSDGDAIPTGGSNPWNTNNGPTGTGDIKYETSDTMRHSNSTAMYKAVNRGILGDFVTDAETDQLYVSWWFKYDADVSGGDHSSKWIRLYDGNGSNFDSYGTSWTQAAVQQYEDGGINVNKDCSMGGDPDVWHFYEHWYDGTGDPNKLYIRMDGVNQCTNTDPSIEWADPTPSGYTMNGIYRIGFDGGGVSPPTVGYVMCDIYVDNSLARVMLGNASTYSACTAFEMQPCTSWSSDSITFTANTGAITVTGWLYVVKEDDSVVNSSGYSVSI